MDRIKTLVEGINPGAKSWVGSNGVFPTEEIFEMGTDKAESVERIACSSEPDHHHHHHHSVGNSHEITTFTLTFPDPLDLDRLSVEMDQIVNLYRDQVYRVKGFIAVPNYPNRVILQSARSNFVITDGKPWDSKEDRVGKLVFIGRGLKREAFEKRFFRHMKVGR